MEDVFGKYLSCVADYVEGGGIQRRFQEATENAKNEFIVRLFNGNATDISGKGLGGYSSAYKKRRIKAGLAVDKKRLQFSGDLKKNIFSELTEEGDLEIFIFDGESSYSEFRRERKNGKLSKEPREVKTTARHREKAYGIQKYQMEQKGNEEIFLLNDQEYDNLFDLGQELISEDIEGIANDCV